MKEIKLELTDRTVVLTEIYEKNSVDPIFEVINEALKKQYGIDFWEYEEPAHPHEELEGILLLKPEDLSIKYEAGEFVYQSQAIKEFTFQFELGPIHNEWGTGKKLPEYDITVEFNGCVEINVSSEHANTWAEFLEQPFIQRDKLIAFKTGLNWLLNSNEDLADDLMQAAYQAFQTRRSKMLAYLKIIQER